MTGKMGTLAADDFRAYNPRYQGENLEANRDRFAPLMNLAQELRVTPAQLSLAWLLHQGDDIIPVPGTRKKARVEENAKAAEITLSVEVVQKISTLAPPGLALGQTLL